MDHEQFQGRQVHREDQATRRENRGEFAWPTCFQAVSCQHQAEDQHRQVPGGAEAWHRKAQEVCVLGRLNDIARPGTAQQHAIVPEVIKQQVHGYKQTRQRKYRRAAISRFGCHRQSDSVDVVAAIVSWISFSRPAYVKYCRCAGIGRPLMNMDGVELTPRLSP